MVPFSWGLVLWTQENKTKRKSAMLARQVSRKIEKANTELSLVWKRRRMQRFGSQKVGKIQQGKSEKTQRKKGRDQCHSQGIQNASPK